VDSAIGRGGFRRPVTRSRGRVPALVVVAVTSLWLLAAVSIVDAHGGVATLQLGSERVNPGGTLELLGDMTAEGPVDIGIVAGAGGEPMQLGTATADETGHFLVYMTVPSDLPVGSYVVRARSASDEASAPLSVVGHPLTGDDGQLPGQDEALAGVPTSPPFASVVPDRLAPRPPAPSASAMDIVVPLAVGLVVALGLGAFVRLRARRT